MERIAEKPRKALDLLRYFHSGQFNYEGATRDVAAVSTEVGTDRPVVQRVHRTLETISDHKVVNWPVDRERDVSEQFLPNLPESIAGEKIRDMFLAEPAGTMFAWFSPSGGPYKYDEGRLRIGVIKNKIGHKILESYGIPILDDSLMIPMINRLQEFSEKTALDLQNIEDIRDKVVVFSPPSTEENWLKFLANPCVLPEYQEIWKAIESGEIGRFNRKALRESRIGIKKAIPQEKVRIYMSEHEALLLGSRIEQQMIAQGWNMISKVCGLMNSDILSGRLGLNLFVGIENNQVSVKTEWVWTNGDCIAPDCGRKNVEVGPCKVCRKCQEKYDAGEKN